MPYKSYIFARKLRRCIPKRHTHAYKASSDFIRKFDPAKYIYFGVLYGYVPFKEDSGLA